MVIVMIEKHLLFLRDIVKGKVVMISEHKVNLAGKFHKFS